MASKKVKKLSAQEAEPPVNFNKEWQRALQVNRKAESLRLSNIAQNTNNQNTYNKAQRAALNDTMSRATKSPQPAARGDVLSGRTAEGGTRSVLEGFRSFIRGGGLRGSGR